MKPCGCGHDAESKTGQSGNERCCKRGAKEQPKGQPVLEKKVAHLILFTHLARDFPSVNKRKMKAEQRAATGIIFYADSTTMCSHDFFDNGEA